MCGALLGSVACVHPSQWLRPGAHPLEITGVWLNLAQSSATDTIAWVLAPNGDEQTMIIHVAKGAGDTPVTTIREVRKGLWFLNGALTDSARRAICYQPHSRGGSTCVNFRLDTLPQVRGVSLRRRLTVLGFQGERPTGDRVLLERRP
jgi:hypothetical protein